MTERYRSYYYLSGKDIVEFRLEGILNIFSDDKSGLTLALLANGETVVIAPGWISTKFLTAPPPPPPPPVSDDKTS